MAEEIDLENGTFRNFEGQLTLTLEPGQGHTFVKHSSSTTSTHIPNFIRIRETLYGRTYGRTVTGTGFIRSHHVAMT